MLCRNRVTDFAKWKEVFDSHAEAQRAAGLTLVHFWRTVDKPNNVVFLFEVKTIEKAKAFINAAEAAEAGKAAGVVDGDYQFLENLDGN